MKPPGIPDIAQALGISIGTVDRALHNRAGISPATRARVLAKAQELGYRPNIAARSLKLNRRLRIAAYFPQHIASFYDQLRAGVQAAASASAGLSIDLLFRTFPRLDQGDLDCITADQSEPLDGVLLAPGNPRHIAPAIADFHRRGIPVICVSSDAPRTERMASVAVDALTSGAIAAELFARVLQHPGTLATITGDLTTLDHAEKLRGFAANLALLAPHLSLLPALESHELPDLAYRQTLTLLDRTQPPLGIYLSTANSIPALRALEERQLLGKVQVITTDLFPELVPFLEAGKILATLHQRPFAQGKSALEILLNFLLHRLRPTPLIRLAPHIVLQSNLPLFLGQIDSIADLPG